jgi:hypothetical protein
MIMVRFVLFFLFLLLFLLTVGEGDERNLDSSIDATTAIKDGNFSQQLILNPRSCPSFDFEP